MAGAMAEFVVAAVRAKQRETRVVAAVAAGATSGKSCADSEGERIAQ